MLAANVYKLNEVVGRVLFDGASLSAEPAESGLLKGIVAEPICIPEIVDPAEEPESFIRGLHRQYRNAYLRVGEAKEINRP